MSVDSLSKSLAVKSNDMMMVIYLSSLIRSILALHKLIDNKEQRLHSEKQQQQQQQAAKAAPAPTENGQKQEQAASSENGSAKK